MKINFLIIIVLFISLSSCNKLTQFYFDIDSELSIPSTAGPLLPFEVFSTPVETNASQKFAENDTDKAHIDRIKLQRLHLVLQSPNNETFSFLESVKLFISSPNHSEKQIAYNTAISDNIGKLLTFTLIDQDLQDFVKDDNYTLRIEVVADQNIPEEVNVLVRSRFFVDAKLIK